ncbi:hypothetical protein TREMEDRAFT_59531 [Tremella mesenterica DSM 1558]|uniref:uncharacterized protein n=1 Tax=Tremella mesenterica (strain ATCC 24925 / CBS 8224 / DSM 1558 / NBRC 9311 / NRRL Y-6157 / RJB 2259-6 / UBC 559-6) TaxID=578456 RepID=UPI0003F49C45|nr:uncharacterized protein TREMEDRAFT_59531 [Tremella mesenterica DSM 1558]EIW73366.1 hypothetical protein TREMEDRAFT_59531 [Tremella mesenterica DSM 1558]
MPSDRDLQDSYLPRSYTAPPTSSHHRRRSDPQDHHSHHSHHSRHSRHSREIQRSSRPNTTSDPIESIHKFVDDTLPLMVGTVVDETKTTVSHLANDLAEVGDEVVDLVKDVKDGVIDLAADMLDGLFGSKPRTNNRQIEGSRRRKFGRESREIKWETERSIEDGERRRKSEERSSKNRRRYRRRDSDGNPVGEWLYDSSDSSTHPLLSLPASRSTGQLSLTWSNPPRSSQRSITYPPREPERSSQRYITYPPRESDSTGKEMIRYEPPFRTPPSTGSSGQQRDNNQNYVQPTQPFPSTIQPTQPTRLSTAALRYTPNPTNATMSAREDDQKLSSAAKKYTPDPITLEKRTEDGGGTVEKLSSAGKKYKP